jgi:CO/xanthine dehydrogenase FAD-binding subunit
MITSYFRPQTLEEALKLLSEPNTHPLGGGTMLSRPGDESYAVVDLQSLGLDKLRKSGNHFEIGATVPLQSLLESPHTPAALITALKQETTLNLRTMGTVAGTLVTCDGRSPFAAVLLALDTKMTILGAESETIHLGDYLPQRPSFLQGKLITKIEIPLHTKIAFETVARTLDDKPIICAALAQWPSGRTRLVIGGWGPSPTVAMDGSDASGIEASAHNAAHDAAEVWASAEYRAEVAAVLAKRCLEHLH